ncbi:ribonuclease [Pseudomonas sp. NPDC087336]|uniref:ribonuclease T2 family protein n=1 Tax=Pseudomonas sp. NPDC087336 TaxID=3364436 RepID=UPI00381057B8
MNRLNAVVALIVLTFANVGPSSARDSGNTRPQSVAGVFDYYLLALSWSPTYCLTHADDAQCSGKGYGFVLHGLWPQYTRGGWPKSCAPRVKLSSQERAKGLMLFPSQKLLEHEWAKHGTCSGLGAIGYLEASDKALGAVRIPEQLQPLSSTHYFSARDIAQMFRQSNPGMAEDGIVVICNGPQLSEVRVCMDKDLVFASCGKGVKTQCRAGDIRVPPLR